MTIVYTNDNTGTDDSANYDIEVSVNGETIAIGRVEGHNRLDKWNGLVARAAREGQWRLVHPPAQLP